MKPEITHSLVRTNGINLNVAQAGPEDGPLVLLLHGFPEFWYGWRHQIPALAAAGFRVWAPDQRGYNLSDRPRSVSSYEIAQLAKDVIGLIEAAGRESAFLVGHDWGAAVAWWVAGNRPRQVKKLGIINVPHPAIMRRTLWGSWAQMRRSWYIFFFQIPGIPEALLRRGNWRNACRVLQGAGRQGPFTEADLDQYRRAWSRPGAIRGMIHWYRAAMRSQISFARLGRIEAPTLMIWGAQDVALGREMARPSIDLCGHGRLEFVENAGHFVQHEEPVLVNRLLIDFLKE